MSKQKKQALEAALLADGHEISRWTSEHQRMDAASAFLCITELLKDAGVDMDMECAKFRAQIVEALLHQKDWCIMYQKDDKMSLAAARLHFIDEIMFPGTARPQSGQRMFGSSDTVAYGGFEGDCKTALITASATGRLDLVRLLLEHGADPHSKSSRFGRALDVALLRGYKGIAKVLDAASSNTSTKLSSEPRMSASSLRSTTKPWLL